MACQNPQLLSQYKPHFIAFHHLSVTIYSDIESSKPISVGENLDFLWVNNQPTIMYCISYIPIYMYVYTYIYIYISYLQPQNKLPHKSCVIPIKLPFY